MVVEASMKAIALVVDQERPTDARYCALVVEKKLLTDFHASAEVVDHARPAALKTDALVVENEFAR